MLRKKEEKERKRKKKKEKKGSLIEANKGKLEATKKNLFYRIHFDTF